MIKQEFQDNQTFRYPEEYDKFNQAEEKKMKHVATEKQGLDKADYTIGALKKEEFEGKDKVTEANEKGKRVIARRQQIAFEKDLIEHAQAYAKQASNRLLAEQGTRKTTRKSLAEIYKDMKQKHPLIIEQ